VIVTEIETHPKTTGEQDRNRPVRIGAIGDLHLHDEIPAQLTREMRAVDSRVDLVVIAGDITDGGRLPEGQLAYELLCEIKTPMIAVLGNHDRRGPRRVALRKLIESAGVKLLDGDAYMHDLPDGRRIGVAGVGGYGGGFWPEETPDIPGARLSKAVGVRARREAARLESALNVLARQQLDAVIVLLHYAPTTSTLGDEPLLKYWMLGNSLLGRVIDQHNVDLVIHGHAHLGNEYGQTPGGTPVRNVAAHVTGGPVIYDIVRGKHVDTVRNVLLPVRDPNMNPILHSGESDLHQPPGVPGR
jgi:Icc-related predicted phosphoesterase